MKHGIIKPEIQLQPTQGGRKGKNYSYTKLIKLFVPQGTIMSTKRYALHVSLNISHVH